MRPAPERAPSSWPAFLRAQAVSVLACDFLTVETAFLQRAEGELGLREAIEARYRQLEALLEERLGLEPSKGTRRLHLQLLSQA